MGQGLPLLFLNELEGAIHRTMSVELILVLLLQELRSLDVVIGIHGIEMEQYQLVFGLDEVQENIEATFRVMGLVHRQHESPISWRTRLLDNNEREV